MATPNCTHPAVIIIMYLHVGEERTPPISDTSTQVLVTNFSIIIMLNSGLSELDVKLKHEPEMVAKQYVQCSIVACCT